MSTDPSYTQEASDRRAARFANFQDQARREGSNVQASNDPPPNSGRYITSGIGSQTSNSDRTGGELALIIVCALVGILVASIYRAAVRGYVVGVRAYQRHQARRAATLDRKFDKRS